MRLSVRRKWLQRRRDRREQALVQPAEVVLPVKAVATEKPVFAPVEDVVREDAGAFSTPSAEDQYCDPDGDVCVTWVAQVVEYEPPAEPEPAQPLKEEQSVVPQLLETEPEVKQHDDESVEQEPSDFYRDEEANQATDDEDAEEDEEDVSEFDDDLDDEFDDELDEMLPESSDGWEAETQEEPSHVLREVRQAVLRAALREDIQETRANVSPPKVEYPPAPAHSVCAACKEPAVYAVGAHHYCRRCSPTTFKRKKNTA